MKVTLRNITDLSLVALAILAVLIFAKPSWLDRMPNSDWGCAPAVDVGGKKVACALPATYEELAKAFVCVCPKAGTGPVGSGVLIGGGSGDRLKVCLVTARHVAELCIVAGGPNSVSFILHRQNADNDYRKTYSGEGLKWLAGANGSDLASVEVTQAFQTSRSEGIDVKYVPLKFLPTPVDDVAAVQGTFLIRREDFARFGIGLGTEVGSLGFAGELWSAMQGRDRQPMAFRAGHIAIRNDEMKTFTPSGSPTYIVESNMHPGFSGGPVFAHYQVNGLTYPALIGIVQDVVASRGMMEITSEQNTKEKVVMPSGYAAVAPIDELLH